MRIPQFLRGNIVRLISSWLVYSLRLGRIRWTPGFSPNQRSQEGWRRRLRRKALERWLRRVREVRDKGVAPHTFLALEGLALLLLSRAERQPGRSLFVAVVAAVAVAALVVCR